MHIYYTLPIVDHCGAQTLVYDELSVQKIPTNTISDCTVSKNAIPLESIIKASNNAKVSELILMA